MLAKKSECAGLRGGEKPSKRPAQHERRNAAAGDTCKPGRCARHCVVALLLAVMGDESVVPRAGCCLLADASAAYWRPRERAVASEQAAAAD